MSENTQLVPVQKTEMEKIEKVLIAGDLSVLTPGERVIFVKGVCQSLGLNYLTKPFEFISFQGKMLLYARKDATEQLRKIHGVSVDNLSIEETPDEFIVLATGHDRDGKTDSDIGVVNKTEIGKDGKPYKVDRANAKMKAVTKAKRRLTLSICGLGWLDESELDGIKQYRVHNFDPQTGEFGKIEAPKLDPVQAEIERLTNEYAIESVLTANNGVIPTTLEECAEIERIIKAAIAEENEADVNHE